MKWLDVEVPRVIAIPFLAIVVGALSLLLGWGSVMSSVELGESLLSPPAPPPVGVYYFHKDTFERHLSEFLAGNTCKVQAITPVYAGLYQHGFYVVCH